MKKQFAAGAVVLAVGALAAPALAAKHETLAFYQVAGPTRFYSAAGRPLHLNPPASVPKAGDYFDVTDTDYAGNDKQHARESTATDHLRCHFTSTVAGRCDFQIAIGSSLIVFNQAPVHFRDSVFVEKVSEGTGQFKGVTGTLTDTNLPSGNSNLVLRLS